MLTELDVQGFFEHAKTTAFEAVSLVAGLEILGLRIVMAYKRLAKALAKKMLSA
jgi:hypothetical protein